MAALRTLADSQPEAVRPLEGWPGQIDLRLWIVREGDDWYAVSRDFNVSGMGADERAAVDQTIELVCDYLDLCVQDGMTYREAVRPLSLRSRVRLRTMWLMSPVLRWLYHRWAATKIAVMPAPGAQAC